MFQQGQLCLYATTVSSDCVLFKTAYPLYLYHRVTNNTNYRSKGVSKFFFLVFMKKRLLSMYAFMEALNRNIKIKKIL